jgi:hypothetical protein
VEPLAYALERFNRKERNLLVRAVLGNQVAPLHLDKGFLATVASALRIDPIASDAWWATDYHLAWLAGALAVYAEGETAAAEKVRDNLPVTVDGVTRHLVEGNQEDIDLVIASGVDLILVEAKGASDWDIQQLESKLTRLNLVLDESRKAGDQIRFRFLLTSPHRPEDLEARCKTECNWALIDSKFPWIELRFPKDPLAVSRCDASGKPMADRDHWRIIKC